MTTLELWLICILCYILIGIIWSIANFLKVCRDIEKRALQDNGNYTNIVNYEYLKPTTIDGIIIIFCWPFYMLYIIGRGVALSIDAMYDFLENHKNLFEHGKQRMDKC